MGKQFLFENLLIGNEKIQEKDNFFSTNCYHYICSKTGKIKKDEVDDEIAYIVCNNIAYTLGDIGYFEALGDYIEHLKKDTYNNIKYIHERIEKLEIEKDFSGMLENEIVLFFQELKNKREQERAKEIKEAEKRKEQEEQTRLKELEIYNNNKIKEGIENVKIKESIDAITFELLLNHYGINISLKTLGWIRKKLNYINENTYSYTKNKKSEKGSKIVFRLYLELKNKIE